jgi:putative copper resistance protein D
MEGALALCRFAHFLAAMALFGASLYVRVLAPPDLARALAPAVRRLAAFAIPLAALSALAWLALEAASMSDAWSGLLDPGALQAVLLDTAFGQVWQGRLLVALALVVALALGRHGPSTLILILSGLLLASLALVGHAAMQSGGVGALHRLNHALHLLAVGAWLGGLPIFALCLNAYRDPARRRDAVIAMRRFSTWGQFDVALVVVTGAVNVALTSGVPFPATTPYRALLAAKLALVAAMIGIALVNRYVVAPRLKPGAPALRILMWTSLAEVALGAAVVALVSLFALLDPF